MAQVLTPAVRPNDPISSLSSGSTTAKEHPVAEAEGTQISAPSQEAVTPIDQPIPRGTVTEHVHRLVVEEIPKHETVGAAIAAVGEAIGKSANNVSALYYTVERKKRGGPARRVRRRARGSSAGTTRRPRSSTAERIDKVIAELETLRARVESAENERDEMRDKLQALQRLAAKL